MTGEQSYKYYNEFMWKGRYTEWYFKCDYEGNMDGFDGVTIAEFDDDMKICNLKEFQSKAEHCYPYGRC